MHLKDEDQPVAVQVRIEGDDAAAVENWRRSQSRIPSRAEAVRALLHKALESDARRTSVA
jgi:hypothetical protein